MSESLAGWQLPESAQVPLRPVTKTDLAYLQIRQKILEGELPVARGGHRVGHTGGNFCGFNAGTCNHRSRWICYVPVDCAAESLRVSHGC